MACTTLSKPGTLSIPDGMRISGKRPVVVEMCSNRVSAAPSCPPRGGCAPSNASACAARRRGACRCAPRARRAPGRASGSSRGGRPASVPRSTASSTAQPGSLSCLQSAKRHTRRQLLDVAEGLLDARSRASHSARPRMPGVSIRTPPPAAARARGAWSCGGPCRRRARRRSYGLMAGQRVGERRLARAREAEQRDRLAAGRVGLQGARRRRRSWR